MYQASGCNPCFSFKEFDHGGCPSGLGNKAPDVRHPAQGLGNGDTKKLVLFVGLHHISMDSDPEVPTAECMSDYDLWTVEIVVESEVLVGWAICPNDKVISITGIC